MMMMTLTKLFATQKFASVNSAWQTFVQFRGLAMQLGSAVCETTC